MKTTILSVGGSIIAPDKPDYFFLRQFKNFIMSRIDANRFIIVCGGGKTNTYYNEAATRVSNVKKEDLDWIGIMATRLNAELVRAVFGSIALSKVIYNPTKKISTSKNIIIAAGWKPGCSTDNDAAILAEQFSAKEIINLTNVSHIYNKDPGKFRDAERLFDVSWKEYRKIIGSKWVPRMNSPFDPVASKKAEQLGLKVVIIKGGDFGNLKNYMDGKAFDGTILH